MSAELHYRGDVIFLKLVYFANIYHRIRCFASCRGAVLLYNNDDRHRRAPLAFGRFVIRQKMQIRHR